ncbi:diguanylate cyclase with TPR repeats [Gracilinema caldarium DSM 7334]|uniref:Diguanylate cyclase with TPR repeats n=2 Tax=Gracilinema caldarium TaxID=215591 RepID=F8F1I0_GRAC1|nr:diguanylate cyclase with TPR repeats [Gracilinema caldarium DSM 7334]
MKWYEWAIVIIVRWYTKGETSFSVSQGYVMEHNIYTELVQELNKELEIAWKLSSAHPILAIEKVETLFHRAEELQYQKGKAWALLIKSRSAFMMSNMELANSSVNKAISMFQKDNEISSLAEAFLIKSAISLKQGSLDKALNAATKTLEIAKSCNDILLEARAENGLGEVLLKAGAVHESLEYLMQASSYLKKLENNFKQESSDIVFSEDEYSPADDEILNLHARLFYNLGNAFLSIGETNNAIEHFELALESTEQNQDNTLELLIYKGLSIAYRRNGNRSKAQDLLFHAIEFAQTLQQDLMLLELYLEQALILIEADIYPEAIETLSRVIAEGEKNRLLPLLSEAYRLRSLAYELMGDAAAALEDYKQFHKNQEAISGEQIAQSKRDAEIIFELERSKNEAEIYRLRIVELRQHKEELEQSNKRLHAVMEIGRVVTASLDLQEIARTVYESLSMLIDVSGFSLAQNDEAHNQIHFILFIEAGKLHEPFTITADSKESFAAYVIKNKELIKLDNIELEYKKYVEHVSLFGDRKTKSLIFAPFLIGGKVLGAISVQSMKERAYTDEDVELLRLVSNYIAIALENSQNHAELLRLNEALRAEKEALEQLTKKVSRLANHDGLTGLPNRLLLGELLDKAILRAARHETMVAVFFLDLDNFKPINDRFGHHTGDLVLIEVAHRFKNALRAMDVIARVGGDEFVALLTDLQDFESSIVVAEKLLNTLNDPIYIENMPCNLGVSIGIALFPKDGKQGDDLLRKADEAMYEIKRKNKNGYAFYQKK